MNIHALNIIIIKIIHKYDKEIMYQNKSVSCCNENSSSSQLQCPSYTYSTLYLYLFSLFILKNFFTVISASYSLCQTGRHFLLQTQAKMFD